MLLMLTKTYSSIDRCVSGCHLPSGAAAAGGEGEEGAWEEEQW